MAHTTSCLGLPQVRCQIRSVFILVKPWSAPPLSSRQLRALDSKFLQTLMKLLATLLTFLTATLGGIQAAEDPWISLFDGKTLEGWTDLKGKPVSKGWTVENGAIHRAGPGGDIITTQEFKDFVLEFEWKISKAGNSGVKYRVQKNIGLEYQILDDTAHPDRKKPNHRTASFYDLLAAPDSKPLKPVGEWNHSKIVAHGPKLEHWLNGELVVTLDQSTEEWQQRFKKSKYRKRERFGAVASPILLQDHQDPVWFRKLRIRRL
jgi:hypothetical protein